MLLMLAQADRDRALAEGYLLILWIALVGLIGIVLMLLVFLNRRMARRRLRQIEQDKADRRAAQSTSKPSAWQQSAERYIDHDKLPEEVPYDSEPDPADEPDPTQEDDTPPPGWDEGGQEPEPDDQPDPYGLFEDKPYRDPDDDEDDADDGPHDWDEPEDDGRR